MKTYSRFKSHVSSKDHCLPEEYENLCRLCLTEGSVMTDIHTCHDTIPIPVKIRDCISLQIHSDDGLPHLVCMECMGQVDQFYEFKKKCLASETKLQKLINGPTYSFLSVPYVVESNEPEKTTLEESDAIQNSMKACTINMENEIFLPITEADETDVVTDENSGNQIIKCISIEETNNRNKNTLFEEHIEIKFGVKNENGEEEEESMIITYTDGNSKELSEKSEPFQIVQKKVLQHPSEGLYRRKNVSKKSKALYTCGPCSCKFNNFKTFREHIRNLHTYMLKHCSICSKSFISNSILERHMRTHTGEKPFVCNTCGRSFSQKEILRRHLVIHDEGTKQHKCRHCTLYFPTTHSLKKHAKVWHSDRSSAVEKSMYQCRKCNKVFCHSSGLSRHQKKHFGIKYQCSICNRIFTDESSIRRHERTIHPDKSFKKS